MNSRKYLILCLLFIFNSLLLGQIQTDTIFTLKGVPVSFNIDAEGMVLSHITTYKDPFYHASAYLGTVITTNIGKNVRIPLRFVAEVWSFSGSYGAPKNMYTWAKPSIQARINKVFSMDSIVFNVGDLWRQKHGQGLLLDYYEAQGGEVTLYKNKIYVSARDMGFGYTGIDDLTTISVGYDSLFAIRYLLNYYDPRYRSNSTNILSIDSHVKVNNNIRLYEEAAVNINNYSKAALIGLNINYQKSKNYFNGKLEFRYYEKDIFFDEQPIGLPFFKSLTALDKPLNQYYTYMIRNSKNITLGGRFTGRYFIYRDFFIDADLEPIIGDIKMFAYEATIGFEPENNVLLRAGIMNKFLSDDRYNFVLDSRYYEPEFSDMFYLDKKPFLFAKASFKL